MKSLYVIGVAEREGGRKFINNYMCGFGKFFPREVTFMRKVGTEIRGDYSDINILLKFFQIE